MPKAWRKCSLCSVDSYNRPGVVIFSTQARYQTSTSSGSRYICELHYQEDEIKVHGNSKRFFVYIIYSLNRKFTMCLDFKTNFTTFVPTFVEITTKIIFLIRLVTGATPTIFPDDNQGHPSTKQHDNSIEVCSFNCRTKRC